MPEEMKNIGHQIWDSPSGSSAAKDPFQFCLMKCLGEGDATSGVVCPHLGTNYPRGRWSRSGDLKR